MKNMTYPQHAQTLPTFFSQDSDSGLSMPSGTTRLSNTYGGTTPRMGEEEHAKLIQSLLRRSMESLPASTSAFRTPHRVQASTPNVSASLGESYLLPPTRNSSPDAFSRLRTPPYLHQRQAADSLGRETLRRSTERLSTFTPENYLTGGLTNALNESQTRRNALLDKLREAQDTLQLQSARVSKMETDYHSSSYQVEELKSSETKLRNELSESETQIRELNELRLRSLDLQITLQDRVKELEGALQNMATDFQLLEADHDRRRELVEQLSTTVELVEEENRKLHKVEQSINTEIQCLQRDMAAALEEKDSMKNQVEGQKREARHWREETEKQQNLLRQSQDSISELKVKVSSLTHKLENAEAQERAVQQDNEALRAKDRELHDTMTDLKSRVAILSADKDRIYQEKSDINAKIESVSLLNKQLQEEVHGLQLSVNRSSHDVQTKENSISQLTSINVQLREELSGSEKVGEKLSLELKRTKEIADGYEEEMVSTKAELKRSSESNQSLEMQLRETSQQLAKLQTENDYLKNNFDHEKKNLQQKIEQLQSEVKERTRHSETLSDSVADFKRRLADVQQSTSLKISELESKISWWENKDGDSVRSLQKKEKEIANQSKKILEYENQINLLLIDNEAKQIDYGNYTHSKEELNRLSMVNRRITQENAESEQMVQLLQTQRDIYARSVQEYTGKALEADRLAEESRQLQSTVDTQKSAKLRLEEELKSCSEARIALGDEVRTLNTQIENLKAENNAKAQDREKVEQENSLLKNAVRESFQLKQQLQEMEGEMAMCKSELDQNMTDKSVISHLSEQNTKLNERIQELTTDVAALTKSAQEANYTFSQSKDIETRLGREISDLQEKLKDCQISSREMENGAKEARGSFHQSELEKANLSSQIVKLKAEVEKSEKRIEEQRGQLMKAAVMEEHCKKLQQRIEELSNQCQNVRSDNDSLSTRISKVEVELQIANRNLEEQTSCNRQLTTDLKIADREKQHLQSELGRVQKSLGEVRNTTAAQLEVINGKLEKSEGGRQDTQQRLQNAELDLQQWKTKHNWLTDELSEKSAHVESLRSTAEALRAELLEYSQLHNQQEELIATLKDETCFLSSIEAELKEARKKYKEMKQTNDDQEHVISTLQKEAEQKEQLEKQLHDIGTDLVSVKTELQRTYSSMNQKELEMERLQQQLNNANMDAENSDEKAAELRIRLEQTEKAKEVAMTTLQDRIHSLEADIYTYKTQVMKLEHQLAEVNRKMSSASSELTLSNHVSALNTESLTAIRTERDISLTECTSLRAQNAKLITEQRHADADKRKAQLELKEGKIDMFKLEKEKENLEQANARLDSSVSESNRLLKSLTMEHEAARSRLLEIERANHQLMKDYNYVKSELTELMEKAGTEKAQLQLESGQYRSQVLDLRVKLRELEFEKANHASASPRPVTEGTPHTTQQTSKTQPTKAYRKLNDGNSIKDSSVTMHQEWGAPVRSSQKQPPAETSQSKQHISDTCQSQKDETIEAGILLGSIITPEAPASTSCQIDKSPASTNHQTDNVPASTNHQTDNVSASTNHQTGNVPASTGHQTDNGYEIPSNTPVITEDSSASPSGSSNSADKMSLAAAGDVLTDCSGDSWPDLHSQPELSETLSSGRVGDLRSTLERTVIFRGTDDVDGGEVDESPFRVREIPVTITILDPTFCSDSTKSRNSVTIADIAATDDVNRAALCGNHSFEEKNGIDSVDSNSDDEETTTNGNNNGEHPQQPALTRDKTMKIFKQLKKAKQRSKKFLAPTPKMTKSLPDIPAEMRQRRNSFENLETPSSVEKVGKEVTDDLNHIKENIRANSGRVEWRGDPRESHRRYVSSCDLSVISDAEEGDSLVETESVSSDFVRSLLNVASADHAGSSDSLQSVGVIDGPLISTAGHTLPTSETGDSSVLSRNSATLQNQKSAPLSMVPVTFSPLTSPQTGRHETMANIEAMARIKSSSNTSGNRTKLPKLSLFRMAK